MWKSWNFTQCWKIFCEHGSYFVLQVTSPTGKYVNFVTSEKMWIDGFDCSKSSFVLEILDDRKYYVKSWFSRETRSRSTAKDDKKRENIINPWNEDCSTVWEKQNYISSFFSRETRSRSTAKVDKKNVKILLFRETRIVLQCDKNKIT